MKEKQSFRASTVAFTSYGVVLMVSWQVPLDGVVRSEEVGRREGEGGVVGFGGCLFWEMV